MSEPRAPGQGGLPAYQGYEYQLEVTIWVALQLMLLERTRCDRIEVEPASEEDIQAALDVPPEDALSNLGLPGSRELQIQVKLRSRPFSANDFKNLVSPSAPRRAGKGGPPPRKRPIDYLCEHEAASYVLITSAQVDTRLAPHVIHHLGAESAAVALPFALPDSVKRPKAEQAGLARRLGILHQQTPEVVRGEISRALREAGMNGFARIPGGRKSCPPSTPPSRSPSGPGPAACGQGTWRAVRRERLKRCSPCTTPAIQRTGGLSGGSCNC
jgi:hypothetical protein